MTYYVFIDHDLHTWIRREGDGDRLRLLLHPSQYSLIRRNGGSSGVIDFCSVSLISCENEQMRVDTLLERMSSCKLPAEAGGWRTASAGECASVGLSASYFHNYDQAPSELLAFVRTHPFVAAGGLFAFHAAHRALLSLLSEIYDILRFADPEHPTSQNRLRMFYRLNTPVVMLQALAKTPFQMSVQHLRLIRLFAAWCYLTDIDNREEEISVDPSSFLFRDYFQYKREYNTQFNEEKASTLAAWKTSRRFATYLSMIWRHGLGLGEFRPDKFFLRPDEVSSFMQYLKTIDLTLEKLVLV